MKRYSKLIFLLSVIALSVLCFTGCTSTKTVTFKNGNDFIVSMTADKDGKVIEPKITTAKGVEVEGWYTSNDFSTKKFDFKTDKISVDTTLYVKLININYTVTYDLGYTLEPNETMPQAPDQAIFNVDGTFTVSDEIPVRTGYEFMGWAYENNVYEAGQTVEATKTGNISLVATWQYRMVTVRFFDNEDIEMEAYTKQIPYGSDVAAPESSVVPSAYFCFKQVDWDNSLENVTKDIDYHAIYEYISSPSYLFEFTMNDDYNSYSVSAKGAAFNKAVEGKIALPTQYNGLDVTAIAPKGFMGATMLESIYIPSSYKVIKTEAFFFCQSLKNIYIEEGLTTIEADAFSLIGLVEYFNLPKSVNDIHWWAFETLMYDANNYNYLSSEQQEIYRNFKFITAEDGFYKWNKTDKVLYGDEGRQLVYVAHDTEDLVIKDTVKEVFPAICYRYYWLKSVTVFGTDVVIGSGAFYNCVFLENFTVTGSVKQIGTDITVYDGLPIEEGAKKVGALTGSAVSSIYFPSGLEYLGVETFSTCYFLTEISLPQTIEYIHERAFDNNYANSDQIFDDILGIYHSNGLNKLEIRGENPYYYCENNTVLIKKGTAEEGDTLIFYCMDASNTEYTIPSNVKKLIPRSIIQPRNLITLTISDGVTEIPQDFCAAPNLATLNIGNLVKIIKLQAFNGCGSLANVIFAQNSQLEEIENWAFYNTAIESITFPNTIKKFGNDFINNIKSLNVEEGGEYYCSKDGILFSADERTLVRYPSGRETTSYTVPEGVEIIGSRAFDGCYYLETITMGTDVRVILEEAFVGNFKDIRVDGELTGFLGLKEVIMNENLQEIHNMAFYGCSLMENITFIGPAPKLIDTPLDTVLDEWLQYVNLNHIFTGYQQNLNEEYQEYLDSVGLFGGMTFTVPEIYLADYYTEWYRHRPENISGFKNLPTVTYNFETNGGSAVQSLNSYALNDMPSSIKEGEYLIGWFTKNETEGWGEEIVYPYIYQANDSVTLYAKWSQDEIQNGQKDIWAYELLEGETINVSVPHGRNGVWFKYTATKNCLAKLTGYQKFMENTILCDAFYFDRLGMDVINKTPMVLKYLSRQTIAEIYDMETSSSYYQFESGTTYYIWFVFVGTIDQDMVFKMSLDFLDTQSYVMVAPALLPAKYEFA